MAKTRIAPRAGALRNIALACLVCAVGALAASSASAVTETVNVTTYHYDNYRTGWNQNETILTPATVQKGSGKQVFEMLDFVTLDDQVDAQPLIVTNQTITGQGTHNVAYVVTENNSVYAIDADSGQILLHRRIAPPVTMSQLPGGCNNNGNNVGITGTPVIDLPNSTMYLIDYQVDGAGNAGYRLHALDLSTLADIKYVGVSASTKLNNGRTYSFNPAVSRQRPALLLANGNVYAGFGSFCDSSANLSRGWVLGWQTGSLTPLASNEMTNKLATDPDSFFLSSVWMSGYGLASGGPDGDIYFVTGNSDYSGTTIDGVQNIAESVVQMSSDLSHVKSIFTPSSASSLDTWDGDYGSGGALFIPPQSGQASDLMVAAGKDGNMYLLDADNLSAAPAGTSYNVGGCWCGESYFTGIDGLGRIVSSGNNSVAVWRLDAKHPALENVTNMNSISGEQDPGFFTSVSSNGTTDHTEVIWAVGRADGSANEYVSLNAFNAVGGATLYTANAGTWPNTNGNANLVPVVANGKVYVASYEGLAIFGLGTPAAAAKIPVHPAVVAARAPLPAGQHEIYGTVRSISGFTATIQKRDGTIVTVNATEAAKDSDLAPTAVGHAVHVRGTFNAAGVLIATVIQHAKDHASMWLPDR